MYQRTLIAAIINRYDPLFEERVLDVATTNGIAKPPTASLKILNKKFKSMSNVVGSGLELLDMYAYFGIDPTFAPFNLICWKRGILYTANGGITPTAYGWKNNMLNGYLDPQTTLFGMTNQKYAVDSAIKFSTIYEGSGDTSLAGPNIIDGRDLSASDNIWYAMDLAAQRINNASNNLNASANLSGIGFKAIVRTSSNNVRLENKDAVMNRTSASTGLNSQPVSIGRRYNFGPGNTSGLGYTEWGAGASLTNTQTQALRATTNQALSDFGLTPIA